MNWLGRLCLAGGLSVAIGVASLAPSLSAQDAPPGKEPEVLTRGPLHEAFAEPVNFNPQPGLSVPKAPPPPVDEIPPDQKPDGENVAWMPGYWSWDEDRNDFIWISGFWRVMPPGRKWIPGYWNATNEGHQWVSGYWAEADQQQAEYLPPPPQTLENGPSTPAPSDQHQWTPGTWYYQETRYVWRPGAWIIARPGWVWHPAHYVYSPVGYVFVDGYWDYSIRRRGVIFAPCYFDPVIIARPVVYVYRPTVCIDVDLVNAHLFCRPRYTHYYFGDYYASTYVNIGITPWFQFHYTRGCYDPVFAYHSWYYRSRDPYWERNVRADFNFFVGNVNARPPRTFVAQQNIINVTNINNTTVINNRTVNINRTRALGRPLNDVVASANKSNEAPVRFRQIDQEQVKLASLQAREARNATRERVDLERRAATQLAAAGPAAGKPGQPPGPRQPIKVDLPSKTLVAKPLPPADPTKLKPNEVSSLPPPPAVRNRPSRPNDSTDGPRIPSKPGSKPAEGDAGSPGKPGGKPSGEEPAAPGKPGRKPSGDPSAPGKPGGKPTGGEGETPRKPGRPPIDAGGKPSGGEGETPRKPGRPPIDPGGLPPGKPGDEKPKPPAVGPGKPSTPAPGKPGRGSDSDAAPPKNPRPEPGGSKPGTPPQQPGGPSSGPGTGQPGSPRPPGQPPMGPGGSKPGTPPTNPPAPGKPSTGPGSGSPTPPPPSPGRPSPGGSSGSGGSRPGLNPPSGGSPTPPPPSPGRPSPGGSSGSGGSRPGLNPPSGGSGGRPSPPPPSSGGNRPPPPAPSSGGKPGEKDKPK
jgi:hypothetical protein